MDLEIQACVLPAPDCPSSPDVIRLWVQDDEISLGLITVSVFNGHRSSGAVTADLRMRPLRTHGPEAVVSNFPGGARIRIRALAMLAERMLLVRSVTRESRGSGEYEGGPGDREPGGSPGLPTDGKNASRER